MLFKIIKLSSKRLPFFLHQKTHSPILLYHSICEKPNEFANFHNITADYLYSQLRKLRKNYEFVEIDEYVTSKNKKNLAAVTFDDGYLSVIEIGLKIIKSLDIPITIFINSNFAKGGYFWRDKVRLIISQGFTNQFCSWVQNSPFNLKFDQNNFYKQTKNKHFNSKHVDQAIDTFFTTYGISYSGMPEFITEDLIKTNKDNLITYGNHSQNHYVMSSLNESEQYDEIVSFEKFIDNSNVKTSKIFSLPFGGNNDLNTITINILRELDYSAILMSRGRLDNNRNVTNGLRIVDRIMPGNNDENINLGIGYLQSLKSSRFSIL